MELHVLGYNCDLMSLLKLLGFHVQRFTSDIEIAILHFVMGGAYNFVIYSKFIHVLDILVCLLWQLFPEVEATVCFFENVSSRMRVLLQCHDIILSIGVKVPYWCGYQ